MKKLVLIALITLCITSIEAQTVIVYSSDTTQQIQTKSKVDMNVFSWNFSLLGRGAIAFEYDRKINDYLQFMVGAGVTLINPWYAFRNFVNVFGVDGEDNLKNVKPGILLEFAPKIFPKQMDDLDGFYISPMYRYKTYNMIKEHYDYNSDTRKEYKHSTLSHDITVTFGWQIEEGLFGAFSSYYFGAGYSFGQEKFQGQTNKINQPLILFGSTIGFSW